MIHVASHFLTGIVASKQVAPSARIVLIYFFLGFMYLFLVYLIPPHLKRPLFFNILFSFGMIAAKLEKKQQNKAQTHPLWNSAEGLTFLFWKDDSFHAAQILFLFPWW